MIVINISSYFSVIWGQQSETRYRSDIDAWLQCSVEFYFYLWFFTNIRVKSVLSY